MKSKNVYHMEATKRNFSSLEELVDFYSTLQQEFIYPLTIPVDQSRVQQMDKEDQTCQTMADMVVDSSLYQSYSLSSNNNLPTQNFSSMQYPKPDYQGYEEVVPLLKPKHSPSTPGEESDRPSRLSPPPPPQPPAQRNITVSDEEQEDWPAPPPSIVNPTPPKISPKPCSRDNRSRRPQSCFVLPSGDTTSFDRLQATEPGHENPSAAKLKLSKTKSFHVQDEGYATGRLRRRTLSLEKISNLEKTNNSNKQATTTPSQLQRSKTMAVPTSTNVISENADKQGPKKSTGKSPFKKLTHLLRKKKTQQKEIESGFHIPILCKTKFVAVADYFGQEGAMEFKKGTEMAIRGVRTDGWWYCYNKISKETGWVLQDYLKPKSNGEWFEAKPVETARDQQVYEKMDGNSDFDDDEEDENYCKYLMPADAGNPDGKQHISVLEKIMRCSKTWQCIFKNNLINKL